jgi:lantibiotic modifying enzyme
VAVEVATRPDAAFRVPALEIGLRLAREAVWHEGRCTWFGDDIVGEGEVIHRSLGGDLYDGTSGVGWCLANLSAATGEDELATTARGALRHALARTREMADVGLYTGTSGVALAAVIGGRLIEDGEIVERGAELAARTARAAIRPSAPNVDLIGGAAGTALALHELSLGLEDEEMLAAAGVLGEWLAEHSGGAGAAWDVRDASSPEPALCGLGHGASGIALALLELEVALGEPRFGEAAKRALEYERSWFSRAHGAWPDLRELDRARIDAGLGPGYPVFWCHGAAGIGLVRLRAYELTADESWLAEAAAAIDAASSTMLRALTAEDGTPTGADLSLCHGVGSVAELHLAAAATTGDEEHLVHARRLVRLALMGRGHEDAELHLPDELPCGVPGGGETAGLMVGLAGIATLMLRLEDPTLMPSPARVTGWAA